MEVKYEFKFLHEKVFKQVYYISYNLDLKTVATNVYSLRTFTQLPCQLSPLEPQQQAD